MADRGRVERAGDAPAAVLDRKSALPELIGRHEDFLIVSGLGGTARDMAALTNDAPHLFALEGAMGAASMVGMGVALARPDRRVLVVTGDAELFMNVGALATIARARPTNLAIVCVDNGRFGETGNQESHSAGAADLEQIALGAGFTLTRTVATRDQLAGGASLLHGTEGPVFIRLRVLPTDPPAVKHLLDPAACRLRFRGLVLAGR